MWQIQVLNNDKSKYKKIWIKQMNKLKWRNKKEKKKKR